DRDVRLEPLPREHGENASTTDDEVGRLVAAGNGQSARKVGHRLLTYYPRRRGRPESAFAGGSAAAEGGAPRRRPYRGGHRRDGLDQLRPAPAGRPPEPERGARAPRLVARE